jgi:hypothetical protein
MSDWLNDLDSAEQILYFEKQFKLTVESIASQWDQEITQLLSDIGEHKWGKGKLFSSYKIKKGVLCQSKDPYSNSGLECEYYWVVRNNNCCGVGYKLSIIVNQVIIREIYGHTINPSKFYFSTGLNQFSVTEAKIEDIKDLLKTLYKSGPNYNFDECGDSS